ncbi:Eukaryotic translation initiation factor 2B, subunit 4 delta, 67kDa [Bulinus truncatus]|nr:Eukaryotic translation initiation factor 2B, subunit 4 delta, 67kDa [Bulinus truncatus]
MYVHVTSASRYVHVTSASSGKSLKIDNRILNLGFQYFHHKIVGANARCLALLVTLKEVIGGYKTPEEKDLARDLEKSLLNPYISYLNYCRPISTSMGNAIKYLKYHISKIPSTMEDEAAISRLQNLIFEFITEKIVGASKTVAEYSKAKINDNDVILIFAGSSLISKVLKEAHRAGKKFRVIVVEGRPRTEGKTMLRFLVRCGIPCSYTYIGSAVYAMSEVTKVFLGAAAMFATGDMYSRSGNSMIAALARANNVPVLVCCETYKFTDKVQLLTGDSNLHAQGRDLINIGNRPQILGNYEELGLRMLNIMYDVTGSKYITCLITEQGLLLASTIPAILRRHEDLLEETAGN